MVYAALIYRPRRLSLRITCLVKKLTMVPSAAVNTVCATSPSEKLTQMEQSVPSSAFDVIVTELQKKLQHIQHRFAVSDLRQKDRHAIGRGKTTSETDQTTEAVQQDYRP